MDSSGKALAESSAKPLAVRTMVSNAKFEVENLMERITFACGNVKLWMSRSNKSWILLWKTNLKRC